MMQKLDYILFESEQDELDVLLGLKQKLEDLNESDIVARSEMITEARIDELLNEISFGDIGKKLKGVYAKGMKRINAPVKDLAASLGNWQKFKGKVFKDKSAYAKAGKELEAILKEFEDGKYRFEELGSKWPFLYGLVARK